MIRKKKPKTGKLIIDLTGPDGNAFVLLGIARDFAKLIGIDPKPITDEMMKGDYENLLKVFDRHFGEYVILER
jgi:hypothetical protein